MEPLTFEECCERVAKKQFGGNKLVTGHRAQFFKEAALMLAEDAARRAIVSVKSEASTGAAETVLGLESWVDWGKSDEEIVAEVMAQITKTKTNQ